MNKTQIDEFNNILEQRKIDRRDLINGMEESQVFKNQKESLGELSSYDNHPADTATELGQMEHYLGMRNMHENNIKDIENAKVKLASGAFGKCEDCETQIDYERLKILPEARLCITCAKKSDQQTKAIRQSHKNRSISANRTDVVYDENVVGDPLKESRGLEFLNEVISYGSAESPQEEGNFISFKEFYSKKHEDEGIVEETDRITITQYKKQLE